MDTGHRQWKRECPGGVWAPVDWWIGGLVDWWLLVTGCWLLAAGYWAPGHLGWGYCHHSRAATYWAHGLVPAYFARRPLYTRTLSSVFTCTLHALTDALQGTHFSHFDFYIPEWMSFCDSLILTAFRVFAVPVRTTEEINIHRSTPSFEEIASLSPVSKV